MDEIQATEELDVLNICVFPVGGVNVFPFSSTNSTLILIPLLLILADIENIFDSILDTKSSYILEIDIIKQ